MYAAGDAPAHLLTQDQLKAQRLRPPRGQLPAAYVNNHPDAAARSIRSTPLYDPAEAERMRPLTPGQQRAMTARRTCPRCGTVGTKPIPRDTGVCPDCAAAAHRQQVEQQLRACTGCSRPAVRPYPDGQRRCAACALHYALWHHAEAGRTAAWARTCPGPGDGDTCGTVTATDTDISTRLRKYGWWDPRCCAQCEVEVNRCADESERAWERGQGDPVAYRRREVAAVQAWAREVLADPRALVLDTETTGTDRDARIVEITALSTSGTILLNTLIDPGVPIPARATAVHGIRDQDVAGAPTLSDLLPRLSGMLRAASRTVAWNAPYDRGRIRYEAHLHHQTRATGGHRVADHGVHPAAAALVAGSWQCAMRAYSTWWGEPGQHGEGYRWQRLGGGHRSLGDCRAVLERLGRMEGDPPSHDPLDGYW
ncbi:exonuclease domain-containing protein [Streptomyces xiamenensis]|uniref:exonuclease domain-containing protein n=1 Tax=Streptomyces xiamenensis TaxID=408015 RepID=UPI0035D72BE5